MAETAAAKLRGGCDDGCGRAVRIGVADGAVSRAGKGEDDGGRALVSSAMAEVSVLINDRMAASDRSNCDGDGAVSRAGEGWKGGAVARSWDGGAVTAGVVVVRNAWRRARTRASVARRWLRCSRAPRPRVRRGREHVVRAVLSLELFGSARELFGSARHGVARSDSARSGTAPGGLGWLGSAKLADPSLGVLT